MDTRSAGAVKQEQVEEDLLHGQHVEIWSGGERVGTRSIKPLRDTLRELENGVAPAVALEQKDLKENGTHIELYFPKRERQKGSHSPEICGHLCNGSSHLFAGPVCRFCKERLQRWNKNVRHLNVFHAIDHLAICPSLTSLGRTSLRNAFQKADEPVLSSAIERHSRKKGTSTGFLPHRDPRTGRFALGWTHGSTWVHAAPTASWIAALRDVVVAPPQVTAVESDALASSDTAQAAASPSPPSSTRTSPPEETPLRSRPPLRIPTATKDLLAQVEAHSPATQSTTQTPAKLKRPANVQQGRKNSAKMQKTQSEPRLLMIRDQIKSVISSLPPPRLGPPAVARTLNATVATTNTVDACSSAQLLSSVMLASTSSLRTESGSLESAPSSSGSSMASTSGTSRPSPSTVPSSVDTSVPATNPQQRSDSIRSISPSERKPALRAQDISPEERRKKRLSKRLRTELPDVQLKHHPFLIEAGVTDLQTLRQNLRRQDQVESFVERAQRMLPQYAMSLLETSGLIEALKDALAS